MAEIKLIVKQDYQSREHVFKKGQIIEVPRLLADWFLADAPLAFEEHIEVKAIDAPPLDKMVHKPRRSK
jgi:hypothetical protein